MRHRPDIDGLRALAILPVVAYHAGVPGLTGGFVGVDVFFVISGYLITGIIHAEIAAGEFRFRSFYERRVRRIMPALLLVVVATFAIAAVYLFSGDYVVLARSALYSLLFLGNFYFADQSGYFAAPAASQPLLHLWSLAVEEQFYILFPLLLVGIARFAKSPRALTIILWGLALASFAVSAALLPAQPAAVFYLLHGRAWELLAGALLVTGNLPLPRGRWLAEGLAVAGLALIAGSCLVITSSTPFPGPAALPAVAGAVLLIRYGETTAVGRILAHPVLVGIGLISYSLYLWHWPVLVLGGFASLAPPALPVRLILVGIAVALSIATYFLVETPFRTRRVAARRGPLFAMAGAAVAVMVGFASLVLGQGGFPQRFPPEVMALARASQDFSTARSACHGNNDFDLRPFAGECVFGKAGTAPSFAVWGDSHAAEISAALGEWAGGQGRSVMELSNSACPPILDSTVPQRRNCVAQNDIDVRGLAATPAIRTVFLAAHYAQYDPRVFLPGFAAAIDRLQAAGKRVVVVYPVPGMDRNVPLTLAKVKLLGGDPEAVALPRAVYDSRNAAYLNNLDWLVAERQAGLVRPSDRLCDTRRCYADIDGTPVYFDDNHLSMRGARLIAPLFAPYLR